MADTPPTATIAGQSIALHLTNYPDIPNRWGAGHIRATGIRLDYGNSHTPDGRHAFVTGLWVHDDGEATTDPIDRYYDAPNGDTSDWPDWIAALAREHVPAPAADRPAVLLQAAKRIDATDFPDDFVDMFDNGARWATTELRRLAAETPEPATQAEALAPMLEGLGRLLATTSRDMGLDRVDAWLYAVIVGWDCKQTEHDETCVHGAMEEAAEQHGWDEEAVAKARRYREVVRSILDGQP